MEKNAVSCRFQAGDFNTEWVKIDAAGLLCETEKREILRNCYRFIYDNVEALEARFTETGLVVHGILQFCGYGS